MTALKGLRNMIKSLMHKNRSNLFIICNVKMYLSIYKCVSSVMALT